MRASYFQKKLVGGVIAFALLFTLLWLLSGPDFNTRWRRLRDGMTQKKVSQSLGNPTATGNTLTIGAGNQRVTRWEYKRGRWTYCVDFDYVGPSGAPVVFRTERYWQDWECPSWWPWQRPKARA